MNIYKQNPPRLSCVLFGGKKHLNSNLMVNVNCLYLFDNNVTYLLRAECNINVHQKSSPRVASHCALLLYIHKCKLSIYFSPPFFPSLCLSALRVPVCP